MVGVAGCVAQAEGSEIVARAPVVDLVVGPQSYQRLPELIGEAADGRRVVATEFDVADKFAALDTSRSVPRTPVSLARPAQGSAPAMPRRRLPHRAGRLRQVLHLLRRALYARRRGLASGRRDRRRGGAACRARRARTHAARPERQRLARRGPRRPRLGPRPAALPPCRDPRHRPAALHHQPSARHGRRPDRRPSRSRCADALSAPAGAVGLGPRPRRHEPPPHRRRLSPPGRAHPRRARRTSRWPATSSSASPARARRISPTPWRSSTTSATSPPSRSSTARGPARRRQPRRIRCPRP